LNLSLPHTLIGLVSTIALAAGLTGCAMAWSYAPMGIEALTAAGSIATQGKTHSDTGDSADDQSDSENNGNRPENVCGDLADAPPYILELRTDAPGPRWREIVVGGSAKNPQWKVDAAHSAAPGGWTAANLAAMDFTPSILPGPPGEPAFIAYAPAVSSNPVEHRKLLMLVDDFSSNLGTFTLDQQIYDYVAVNRLPCFPPPP